MEVTGGLLFASVCRFEVATFQLIFQMEQQVVVLWIPTLFSNNFSVCSDMGKGFIPSF
jgi:hypothetical protein